MPPSLSDPAGEIDLLSPNSNLLMCTMMAVLSWHHLLMTPKSVTIHEIACYSKPCDQPRSACAAALMAARQALPYAGRLLTIQLVIPMVPRPTTVE